MERIGRTAWLCSVALILTATRWAVADDMQTCTHETGDVAIQACTGAINSGRYSGDSLATVYIDRAVREMEKKDYDKALADLNKATQLNSNNSEAYYTRCSLYNILQLYEQAVSDCTRAIELPPRTGTILGAGDQKLALDQTRADYFYERGRVYTRTNDYDRAIADFNETIALYPQDGSYFLARANAYYLKADYTSAIADCSTALRLKPDDAAALYWRGKAKQQMGDTAGGDKDIAAAKKIDPDLGR
jgi:tetratricopeptide (TPR) repeat protein